jgi:hypothetical protein
MRIWILAAAVRSHWYERGGLPTDVRQLVPEYLAEVPDNPFDELRKFEYTKLGDTSFSVSCVPSLSPDAGLPTTPILLTFDFGVGNAPPGNAVREK